MSEREELTIYTLRWDGDRAVGSAAMLAATGDDKFDEPEGNATIYCIVHLNGERIHCAVSATPRYSSDFSTVVLELAPASVKIVECDASEWAALEGGERP